MEIELKEKIYGLIAAPYTPMAADGSVNLDGIVPYARMLAKNVVAGAFVCGTTGESMLLSVEERMAVAEGWVKASPPGFKVIAHVGHTSLQEACRLAAHAQEIGCWGMGAMPPAIFRASRLDELVEFLARLCAAAPALPFYYYHIPSFTGVDVDIVDLLSRLGARAQNLAGVKFTSMDMMAFRLGIELGDGRFDMVSGYDEMTLPALILGGRGMVGSSFNYIAPNFRLLLEAFAAGDLTLARERQAFTYHLIRLIHSQPADFHGTTKAIMKIIGIDVGQPRLPIRPFPDDKLADLGRDLRAIGFFEWCCKT